MTVDFASLIVIWLLPLTASSAVTSEQNNNFTHVTMTTQATPNGFTRDQVTTQEGSSLNPGPNVTQSVVVTEGNATKPSVKPLLEATLTTPSETFSTRTQMAMTPSVSTLSPSSTVGMTSTTEVQSKDATSATTVVPSHASIPTTAMTVPPTPSSSSQSQVTNSTMTPPFTRPTPSISATPKPVEPKSTSTSSVTGVDATQSTGLYKTSTTTTKKPFIHVTSARDRQDPSDKSNKGINHGKVVAGLIGGALLLMMVGFLVIYIKKRKLHKQQVTAKDWAGPSPFLEGGADNGQVTLRSSNRISFSSFLPQRLSKRLSLLPEMDEELIDMTHATTFRDNQGSTFGQEVEENGVQERNGTAVPEVTIIGEVPETVENSVSVPSSDTNDKLDNSEAADISQDHPADPPDLSEAVEQPDDGGGQP